MLSNNFFKKLSFLKKQSHKHIPRKCSKIAFTKNLCMLLQYKILGFLTLFLVPMVLFSQKDAPIVLINPSFEDLPKCCSAPNGWYNCGKTEETAPDIQPGYFSVMKAPAHGETYIGMVVRDNDTWESIGQRLSKPIEVDKCYEFSLDLARSELYLSVSRTTGESVNYATPAKIRIWGGMGYCDKKELLAETSVITNTRWLTYNFKFMPKKGSYTYIMLEAYVKTPTLFPYNGNILVDNASAIRPIPCDDKPLPPKRDTLPKPPLANNGSKPNGGKPVKNPQRTPSATQTSTPIKVDTPDANKFERKYLKKGGIIRLENIYFDSDKFDVKVESEPALQEIFSFLAANPDVVVEIGGHTNNIPAHEFCDKLSESRARSVSDWLVSKGISSERVQYKGYGKRSPFIPNTSAEGRRKNQRVEIKILSMNG
jgi:outer membrane protein OmpA-like peptidoglycan-associated protein